jgi:Trypsin-like peptidase domain
MRAIGAARTAASDMMQRLDCEPQEIIDRFANDAWAEFTARILALLRGHMSLSGQDIEDLSAALVGALNMNQLDAYVHASTGDRLFVEYVGIGKPLKPTIRDLLNELELHGTTALFLRYVYVNKPGKPAVQQLIVQKCPEVRTLKVGADRVVALSAQEGGVSQPGAPTNAIAPGFERNVRAYLPQLDVGIWLRRLLQIERRVCRVEKGDQGLGTGFLVGPEALLTNWHVVEQAKAGEGVSEIKCRFDYIRLPDGTDQPGHLVPLHEDGCVDSSPYAKAETTSTPEIPAPSPDELDYALLRLSMPVGKQSIEGMERGWVELPKAPAPLPDDAPLLVVQHPNGSPMKLALDTQAVIGRNSGGTRIRYRTNTDPGSSGSPCFSIDWNIVALHHYGDPNWRSPKFNQGIPIELIRQRIEAKGFGSLLSN